MAIDPLATGDIVEIIIRSDVLNQACLTVLHYKVGSTVFAGTYFAQLDEINAHFNVDAITSFPNALANVMAPNTTVSSLTIQRVYPTRSPYKRYNATYAGNYPTGTCLTPNISAVVTKQSEAAGRGRAGALHVPGISSDAILDGRLSAGMRAAMDTFASFVDDPYVPVGGSLYMLTPGMFNPRLGAGANFKAVVTAYTEDTVRVMRRRTVGLGI